MPTAACPCEGCLVQAGGCLGHSSCETERGAAHSARVGAPTPHAITHWGKEQAQRLPSAPGMRGQSMAVPLQQVLGLTLEHPQQTRAWPEQCFCSKHVPSQPSTALPSPLHQDGISLCHFSCFFKRDCSGCSTSGQGANESRAASAGGALSRQPPQHPPLTKTLRFPLVNSLKASVTCSFVRVFLKSRFTVPSSFLKRRESGEWDGEEWSEGKDGCFSSHACP